MVLKAASARKRTFPLVADSSPLQAKGKEEGQSQQVAQDPQELCRFPTGILPTHASRCGEEDLGSSPSSSPSSSWEEPGEAWIQCPICQIRFHASEIESHASTCGDQGQASASSPSWLWVE
ncbi:hypothetical protein JD844_033868 [Phrynosoma platyrhinos]|uniref:UBZ2-type domain-containing protein n=1 Tax=Phrynosoma platyrhinos TaxID=52577 RepID=A0ABQ7T7A0_PHRPL|nr:hypothetical protein JD844_033868 [Phrynosoma platyrhinos]